MNEKLLAKNNALSEKTNEKDEELKKALLKINELESKQESEAASIGPTRSIQIVPKKPFQNIIGKVYLPDYLLPMKTLKNLRVTKIIAETYETGILCIEI